MEQLGAMGFEEYKCERALAESGQDVEAAVEFLFSNAEQPESWWRGAAATSAPPVQQPDSMSQLAAVATAGLGEAAGDEDAELERAIALSMETPPPAGDATASAAGAAGESSASAPAQDDEVAQAIAMSLEGAGVEGAAGAADAGSVADRPSDDQIREYQAQVMGAQAESIKDKPLVGEPESLDVLKQEYAEGAPVFVAKLGTLAQRYRWIRRARNDGNCFFRGFAFVRTQPALLHVLLALYPPACPACLPACVPACLPTCLTSFVRRCAAPPVRCHGLDPCRYVMCRHCSSTCLREPLLNTWQL